MWFVMCVWCVKITASLWPPSPLVFVCSPALLTFVLLVGHPCVFKHQSFPVGLPVLLPEGRRMTFFKTGFIMKNGNLFIAFQRMLTSTALQQLLNPFSDGCFTKFKARPDTSFSAVRSLTQNGPFRFHLVFCMPATLRRPRVSRVRHHCYGQHFLHGLHK